MRYRRSLITLSVRIALNIGWRFKPEQHSAISTSLVYSRIAHQSAMMEVSSYCNFPDAGKLTSDELTILIKSRAGMSFNYDLADLCMPAPAAIERFIRWGSNADYRY